MRKVKFIVPIVDKPYYLWQQICQYQHFVELGEEDNVIYPVIYWGEMSDILKSFVNSPKIKARIVPYKDERTILNYPASMKNWLMYKFFRDYPEELEHVFWYLDADVLFTKPFDMEPFKDMVHKVYGSNTASYSDVNYIKSKGEPLFYELCELGKVDAKMIEEAKGFEVGAQYLIHGILPEIWYEIYENSSHMYRHMVETQNKYKPEGHEFGIQAWCSELYLSQWVFMKYGYAPEVSDKLSFSWYNWPISDWEKHPIWHNAGGATENGKDFCKVTHQSSPFRKEIVVSPESISYKYLELIRRTEQAFPELIW